MKRLCGLRVGDRVLSPARGRIARLLPLPDESVLAVVGTDKGQTVYAEAEQITLARKERTQACPDCGFPMYRGGVCWTCRVYIEEGRQ